MERKFSSFSEAIEKYLVTFNDYYVENIHSQIRANTTSLNSASNLIDEAYLLDLHDQTTINAFKNYRKYPYKEPVLEELTNRTSIFLLDHFRLIYSNLEKNKNRIQINNKFNTYKLEALDKMVDLRSLPTGYHTSFPPTPNSCDKCKRNLGSQNVNGLICGHGYQSS